ncbi:MarR family transcriptional regulator [Methylobacillus caricis]|uniref:MarR family winged helix-turn-helix transcriptional regulator n=1 Tax=Methylobacillus caricis TaxID=1971611 RepID=UPI001CFF8C61|nr:MarR family transcriptional regulator [Methylobacillus caricis]MCB5186773.1 MarR family transcriptional regulator [Methylobacillus caricis]
MQNNTFQIFEKLHLLMHQFRSHQFRLIRDNGMKLTHMEFKALRFFSRNPYATLSDLVVHSGRDKAQLAKLINELRRKGLLDSRPDEVDRRSTQLFLSPGGIEIIKQYQEAEKSLDSLAIQGLSQDDCKHLLTILDKIQENLQSDISVENTKQKV